MTYRPPALRVRPPHRRPRSRRGSTGPGAPPFLDRASLSVLFVFLFAMGIGATAGLLGGFQTLPAPSSYNSPFSSVLGIALVTAFLALLVAWLYVGLLRREKGNGNGIPGMGYTAIALFVVILVSAGILALATYDQTHRPSAIEGSGGGPAGSNNSPAGGGGGYGGNGTNSTHSSSPPPLSNVSRSAGTPPTIMALGVTVVLALVLVPTILYLVRRDRRPEIWEPEQPPQLIHTLEQAVASLEAGDLGEARSRIISAYSALLSELEHQQVPELEHSTPREIEEIMSSKLSLSTPSAHDLRLLFEEARYSEHPMGETQALAARQSLSLVIDQLKSRPLVGPTRPEAATALTPGRGS